MSGVLVLLPGGATPPPLPEGVDVRTCATAAEVVAALAAATGDVVLCLDGLDGLGLVGDTAEVAAAAAAVDGTVIEVRRGAWDGETPEAVSAACAGVIAGFGIAGVSAAVALLRDVNV